MRSSVHSRRISRTSLRSRQMNGFDSMLRLLELQQLEACFLGPSSASGTGPFLCLHLPQYPTLANKIGIVCPRVYCRFTVVFLALAFLLAIPLSLVTLSLRAFHLPNIRRR